MGMKETCTQHVFVFAPPPRLPLRHCLLHLLHDHFRHARLQHLDIRDSTRHRHRHHLLGLPLHLDPHSHGPLDVDKVT